MKSYLDDAIKPYKGIDSFLFGSKLDYVKKKLKDDLVPYVQTVDSNKGCVPEIPWVFITIANSITLCFVKDILFEIVLENKFAGKLPNGGYIGMRIDILKEIDASLEYNDDEEDYSSVEGYWVSDDVESGKITSITVFVPEIMEESFFDYKWIDQYL